MKKVANSKKAIEAGTILRVLDTNGNFMLVDSIRYKDNTIVFKVHITYNTNSGVWQLPNGEIWTFDMSVQRFEQKYKKADNSKEGRLFKKALLTVLK